jgi:hypothetical protein
VKVVAKKIALPRDVFFQTIEDSSVKIIGSEARMVNMTQGEDQWAPIIAHHHQHYDPDNNIELLRMQQRTWAYQIIGYDLYKTSITGPLLCCKVEGKELLA